MAASAERVKGDETSAPLPGLLMVTLANAGRPAVKTSRRARKNNFFINETFSELIVNGHAEPGCGPSETFARCGTLRIAGEKSTYSVVWACLREDSLRLEETRQPHLQCSNGRRTASTLCEHASSAQKMMATKQQRHSDVCALIHFTFWAPR